MPSSPRQLRTWTPVQLALITGALAAVAVLSTLRGPGITTDEPLDVRPGRTYVETLRKQGLHFFDRDVVTRVFADNAEHPPLGRWLLGLASTLGEPFEILWLGRDPLNLYLLSGRLAPALAFALLVSLITHSGARRFGPAAGLAAGLALLFMPRVFGHAHLGALDTFITTFWIASLLAADRALSATRPVLGMVGAGAIWSLALLTKIHAWFLIPVVFVWSLVRLRPGRRCFLAFGMWCLTGLILFFLGWPWLWYDTTSRFRAYLGTGVVRTPIRVLYFGQVHLDTDVPWHYPWFYFLVTVPVGLHLLGAIGLWKSRSPSGFDRFPWLLIGGMLQFLALFSTRIPVYDGERLFLMVFPLWALLIGRGFARLWDAAGGRRISRCALLVLLGSQAYGVVSIHPFELSYYNLLVGGLPGAERRGLELTFWGDAVDVVLLDELARIVPADEAVALLPTLYPGQGTITTTRAMARRSLVMSDQEAFATAHWWVVSRRTAYWPESFRNQIARESPVYVRGKQGVWLSAIFHVSPAVTPP